MLDLHLVRFADLAEIQGDHQLPGLAMVNDPRGYFGDGVTDLAGEGAAVEFFKKLGCICCCGHGCFSGMAKRLLGGIAIGEGVGEPGC